MGWSITDMVSGKTPKASLTPIAMGYLETKKADKKLKVKAADDNFERARIIARALQQVVADYRPRLICAEAFSPARNAMNMVKVGYCFGIVADIVVHDDIPFLQATPVEIKKFVTGDGGASKEQVIEALDLLFQKKPKKLLDKIKLPEKKREHPYDSLGAIVACWDTDPMRMARQFGWAPSRKLG